MGLTSSWTLFLVVALTFAAPVGCFVFWNRLKRHRWVQLLSRTSLVVTSQLLAVVLALALANNQFRFYASWSELMGRSGLTAASGRPVSGLIDRLYLRQISTAFSAGHGTVVSIVIPGSYSGAAAQRALVYLPAAYGDPAARSVLFPVVELLHGFPGTPESWTGPLHLRAVLDALISSRHSAPMIAVMPMQNLAFPRDTQCVNVVGGVQVDSFLSHDVQQAIVGGFRAVPDRSGWSIMGYSTGGYCALNLAMRHPALYSSAVSLSGYDKPAHDFQTGSLFAGNASLQNANSPIWRATHLPPSNLAALVLTGRADLSPYRDARQLAAAARPPFLVSAVVFPGGGHNFTFWRALEPYAFSWISRHMSAPVSPLAPPDTTGGGSPVALAQGGPLR